MTRLEILIAAGLLIAVCALSCVQPGYADPLVLGAAAEPSPFEAIVPLKRYAFFVAAAAITLLGLLLEDGRRRKQTERGSAESTSRFRRE